MFVVIFSMIFLRHCRKMYVLFYIKQWCIELRSTVSQENYLQNSFRLIVVTPKELPTFCCGFKMVDSVDSDHLPLTSPIPNIHMWRLHIFSSSKTNVGIFGSSINWGSRRAGQDAGKNMAGLGIPAPWPGSRGSFWSFFFPASHSVLGVWKREGLTKGNTQRRIRCCRFFQNKTSPWNFLEIYICWPNFIEMNLRLLLFKRALFRGRTKGHWLRAFPLPVKYAAWGSQLTKIRVGSG